MVTDQGAAPAAVDRGRLSGRICERVTFCHLLDMWE